MKGRTPKACPRCLAGLTGPKCSGCGWFRLNSVKLSAAPWIVCNPCVGDDCSWCWGSGILPRIRSVAVRALAPDDVVCRVEPKLASGSTIPVAIPVGRKSPSECELSFWYGEDR